MVAGGIEEFLKWLGQGTDGDNEYETMFTKHSYNSYCIYIVNTRNKI